MKPILLLSWLLCLASSSNAGHWYETLRPGVRRSEIFKVAGNPTSSVEDVEIYKQEQGHIECKYENGVLQKAVYYNPPDGALSWTLYATKGELEDVDLEERRTYLKNSNLAVMPTLPGRTVYTYKYSGACYEVDNKFIVIEPIISLGGGSGYFSDKTARILLVKEDGTEEVLYRAADQ